MIPCEHEVSSVPTPVGARASVAVCFTKVEVSGERVIPATTGSPTRDKAETRRCTSFRKNLSVIDIY